MKKIKVLHLTSTRYGIGGVERLLLDMSRKYDLAGFEVAYCNLFCDADGDGAFPKALKEKGLTSFSIAGSGWSSLPKVLFDLRRLLKREQFDIVHLHMLQATVVGSVAAILGGTKTVLTKHYTDDLSRHIAPIKFADLYFTKRADRIAAISEYVKDDMVRLGVDAAKIVNVHNGIDLRAFDERAAESFDPPYLGSGVIAIGSVGSLTERKGHRYLIEAMPAVLEMFPTAYLLLIGEGPEEGSLRKLINDLDLKKNVRMVGFEVNVAPILSALDVYVHPSVNEPFGISLLEAMAARKCVVATNVEGIPEIVVPEETGILIQAGDPSALAGAIIKALEDREATAIMGQKGRRRVEELFTIDRAVEMYQDIYRSVLSA
ncbi:MAG TPA: glycosyltransferase family 4 protein [Pyrinomonadaceae bacterium]|nr:glycosyltransferase family 4 protein [Pyrinomonadaceae bacterium]